MSVECHWCFGTGKDQDAVNAASFPDHCMNCEGTGSEQVRDEDEDEEWIK